MVFTLQSPIKSSLYSVVPSESKHCIELPCWVLLCTLMCFHRAPSPLWACFWDWRGRQGHRNGKGLSPSRPPQPRSTCDNQRHQTWLSGYPGGPAPPAGPKSPTEQAQARDQQVRILPTLYKTSWSLLRTTPSRKYIYIHGQWTGTRVHLQLQQELRPPSFQCQKLVQCLVTDHT